jgi:hypothetical protein
MTGPLRAAACWLTNGNKPTSGTFTPAVEACELCVGRNSRCNSTSRPRNAAPEPLGQRHSHSRELEFFALLRRGLGRRPTPGPSGIRSTHRPESFMIPLDPASSLPTNLPGSLIRGRRFSSLWACWPSVSCSSTPLSAACEHWNFCRKTTTQQFRQRRKSRSRTNGSI